MVLQHARAPRLLHASMRVPNNPRTWVTIARQAPGPTDVWADFDSKPLVETKTPPKTTSITQNSMLMHKPRRHHHRQTCQSPPSATARTYLGFSASFPASPPPACCFFLALSRFSRSRRCRAASALPPGPPLALPVLPGADFCGGGWSPRRDARRGGEGGGEFPYLALPFLPEKITMTAKEQRAGREGGQAEKGLLLGRVGWGGARTFFSV